MLHFWKYQGLGNDFVVVEATEFMSPDRARRLCDRRRGVGADGVLSILPGTGDEAAAMHVFNADGSVAEMCGNGLRCVVRHLADVRGLHGDLTVGTGGGPKRCRVLRDGAGHVEAIAVEMGPARVEGEQLFEVAGERLAALRVSMGNPHAVLFDRATRERAAAVGPVIEAAVPGGVNVGFATPRPGPGAGLDLVVWERGAGLTDACGTGACAAAIAAVKAGHARAGVPIEVRLPGGPLTILVAPDLAGVEMRGPAEQVFEGTTAL